MWLLWQFKLNGRQRLTPRVIQQRNFTTAVSCPTLLAALFRRSSEANQYSPPHPYTDRCLHHILWPDVNLFYKRSWQEDNFPAKNCRLIYAGNYASAVVLLAYYSQPTAGPAPSHSRCQPLNWPLSQLAFISSAEICS